MPSCGINWQLGTLIISPTPGQFRWYKSPGPGLKIGAKPRGLPGGDVRAWNWLMHNLEISLFTCSTQECHGILIGVNGWFELWCIVNMPSSVCSRTLLELHVGSQGQQPTGAISAHVMALTHKPSFGRSVSQKRGGKWKNETMKVFLAISVSLVECNICHRSVSQLLTFLDTDGKYYFVRRSRSDDKNL